MQWVISQMIYGVPQGCSDRRLFIPYKVENKKNVTMAPEMEMDPATLIPRSNAPVFCSINNENAPDKDSH